MSRSGACLLSLVISTSSSAATLQAAYAPSAGDMARDAPVKRQNRAPIPAPAPTSHYAVSQGNSWTL